MTIAPESWRSRLGTIRFSVEAGQPLWLDMDGMLSRSEGLANCVALEAVEILGIDQSKPCKVQMLQATPPPYAVKVCNCGHTASQHRSSDDHCNVVGCACERPTCGH